MGVITDLSNLVSLLTGGGSAAPQYVNFWKDARVTGAAAVATIAGRMTSLWQYEGSPAHGAVPGAVAIPVAATNGGLRQINPGGGRQLWLGGTSMCPNTVGTIILYDRLLHISGLNATTITAQTVGGSLTRYTNGIGNQIWLEIYTQIGVTGTTITASYTNDAGTASRTTQAIAFGNTGLREANRLIPMNLQSGDIGVQAIANVTVLATTGTAGDFGVNIVHPLAYIPCPLGGTGVLVDFISGLPGLVEVLTDACLSLAWIANGTTSPVLLGNISLIEK